MGAIDTLPVAEQIEAIYIGYYGRAADAGGLAYWEQYYSQLIASGNTVDQTLTVIANDFAPQNETVGLYPFLAGSITTLSTADLQVLVTQIYQNLFGVNPDTGGEGYWVGQLQSGAVSLGSAILAIANGATGVDATVLADRIEVANTFSSETAQAGIGTTSVSQTFITEARDVILSIGAGGVNDPASLAEQISEADAAIANFVANGGTVVTGPGVTFTLTPNQDTFVGYGSDIFNAPLAGVVGAQSATLQSGDSLTEVSPLTNGVLNATFNPTDTGVFDINGGFGFHFGEDGGGGHFHATVTPVPGPNFVEATIEGIATWNLTGVGDVFGVGPYVAIDGGPTVTGLTTVNVNNSSLGTFMEIGGGGASGSFQPLGYGTPAGAQGLVTTIGASNDAGGGYVNHNYYTSGVNVIQLASLFTATTAVQVNLSNVGNGPPSTDTYSQDYVRGIDQTFDIIDGPNTGTAGVVTWNIASGGVANYIYLATDYATSATTINITGAGALTLFGDGYAPDKEWINLTTINASTMTGNLTITGALNGDYGILNDAPLLTSVTLGSGTNFIDLSGYSLAQLDAMTIINGGSSTGDEVILDNSVLTGATAPIPGLTGFTIIGDAGTDGFSSGDAGTINWANLPATANELIFYGGLDFTTTGLVINNAPQTFTVNFQNNEFNDNNITINDVSTTSTTDSLTLILGCNLNGSDATGFHSVVTINGYATVTIDAIGVNHFATGGENSFVGFDLDSNPGSAPHVIITGMASFDFGTSYFTETSNGGDLSGETANAIATIGTASVSVGPGGVITDTDTGQLYLASTDASQIDASTGGGLFMSAPDTNAGEGVTVIGSSGNLNGVGDGFDGSGNPGNLLQGSLGILASSNSGGGGDGAPVALALLDQLHVDVQYENPLLSDNSSSDSGGYSDVFTGTGGTDSITGGADGLGDWIFTTGGGVGFGVAENADTPGGFMGDTIKDGLGGGVFAGGVLEITPNGTTVNLNNPGGGDIVFYSQFVAGPVGGIDGGSTSTFAAPLAVTDNYGQFLGGGEVTINGFVPGAGGDVIDFALASFGYGEDLPFGDGALNNGLVNGAGTRLEGNYNSTDAIFQNINSSGVTINDFTNVIIDGIATYANAAALSAAIANSGSALTLLGNPILPGNSYDFLIAYAATGGGVNIALEQFTNNNAFPIHNTGVGTDVTSEAVDLVHIAGITLASLTTNNIHFL